MLYLEIVAVCSQIHTKHINTALWAERRNVKLLVHIVTTELHSLLSLFHIKTVGAFFSKN